MILNVDTGAGEGNRHRQQTADIVIVLKGKNRAHDADGHIL